MKTSCEENTTWPLFIDTRKLKSRTCFVDPSVFCFVQVMLAILIGLLTILTWHFTKIYTTKSLNSLAYGLRYELLQRPILRMWNILNSTAEITTAQVKLSQYVIRRYSNPATHAEQVEVSLNCYSLCSYCFIKKRKKGNYYV